MGKVLRNSPLVIAAAALAVTPAHAQPMALNTPSNADRVEQGEEQASAPIPESAPAQPSGGGPMSLAPPQPETQPEPPAPAAPTLAETQPAHTAPPPPPPAPPRRAASTPAAATRSTPTASVRYGEQEGFTRVSFRFAGPTSATTQRNGTRLEVRFSRAADIDLAELRAAPPRFVTNARLVSSAGQNLRVALDIDAAVTVRAFEDGDRFVVDLVEPPPPPPARPVSAASERAPDPPPRPVVSGAGVLSIAQDTASARFTIRWPGPVRAAAFRRGEALWMLFEATGGIDLSGVDRVGRVYRNIEVVRGDGIVGLRVAAEPDVMIAASGSGAEWRFTLAPSITPGAPVDVRRDTDSAGRGRLMAEFGGSGVVRWIADPEIGDRIGVALVDGPVRGVATRRATLEAAVLPAAQGAVIEARADGVQARFDGNRLIVTRGDGLIASPDPDAAVESAFNIALVEAQMEQAAPSDQHRNARQGRAVRDQLDELLRRAADEGIEQGAPVTARMALARFYLEHDLAAETLGALRMAAVNHGELVELDPEYRLMRAAANVMMGRVSEANADLNSSALSNDPTAALWRGYAAALNEDWPEARRELEKGASALEGMSPRWRAQFQLALASAALELNDFGAADRTAAAAIVQTSSRAVRLKARLIQAEVRAARGDTEQALEAMDELASQPDEEVAVRATLNAIRLRRQSGALNARQAIEQLEALRYRWRGDGLELRIIGDLGDTYAELGQWREAFTTMQVAETRLGEDPAGRKLRQDMTTLFERLFLDGEADELEPIQALGLFYEFSELTPPGPNGDRIVRLLAGRLVKVDLLEQAAQLLQHQVNERLTGAARAQVAADLATIYLLDGKYENALLALNSTRQANIPDALVRERRILQARALIGVGRLDHAVELVERDNSEEAHRVRAEAAWRARDWPRAATELQGLLAARDRALPLDADARSAVLRAGVALTLSGNEAGVRQLYRDYAGDMAGKPEADAFEVVASGINADGAGVRDIARIVARTDLLDRFMQGLRARITADAPASDTPRSSRTGPQASADPQTPPPA